MSKKVVPADNEGEGDSSAILSHTDNISGSTKGNSKPLHHRNDFRIASFNILCDGLSYDEFFCDEGETNKYTAWSYREDKISDILINMFCGMNPADDNISSKSLGIDVPACIIVTQENDHFFKLLHNIRRNEHCKNVAGVWGVASKIKKTATKPEHGTCFRVKAQRLLRGANVTDEHILSDKAHLYSHVNGRFLNGTLDDQMATFTRKQREDDGRALEVIRSYRDECEDDKFVHQALQIYKEEVQSEKDLFLTDDGLGIYYNRDVLELVEVGFPGHAHTSTLLSDDSLSTSDAVVMPGVGTAIRCLFRIRQECSTCSSQQEEDTTNHNKYLLFYGAHLKSGEGVKDAITRHDQLKALVDDWNAYVPSHPFLQSEKNIIPVIAMDSNNSVLYEMSYPPRGSFVRIKADKEEVVDVLFEATLSAYLAENGLKDGIHEQDEQHFGKNQCLKMRNGKTEQKSKAFQLMFDTLDKIIVPMDLAINTTHKNYFGFRTFDDVAGAAMAEIRSSSEKRKELYDKCMLEVHSASVRDTLGVDSPFLQLYPNQYAPSDHPPVSVVFQF